MSISDKYKKAAEAIEEAVAPIAKIKVTSISPAEKPRVIGDLVIQFTLEQGSLGNGARLLSALTKAATQEGAPRSVSTYGQGYRTHMVPKNG